MNCYFAGSNRGRYRANIRVIRGGVRQADSEDLVGKEGACRESLGQQYRPQRREGRDRACAVSTTLTEDIFLRDLIVVCTSSGVLLLGVVVLDGGLISLYLSQVSVPVPAAVNESSNGGKKRYGTGKGSILP